MNTVFPIKFSILHAAFTTGGAAVKRINRTPSDNQSRGHRYRLRRCHHPDLK